MEDLRSAPVDHLAASRARLAAGDAKGAHADAVQAARRAPADWTAQAQLVETAEAVGAAKVGLEAATRWVNLRPDQAEAHAAVGRMNMALDRGPTARHAFYRAWQLNPHHRESYLNLTLLDAMLPGRHRRAAMGQVERLVADGQLGAEAVPTVLDASVTVASRWLSFGTAYLTLGYMVLVVAHTDTGQIRAGTWWRPAIASVVVAAGLLWWFRSVWRGLTPSSRRFLPGMVRREPLQALSVVGPALALLILLAVPVVWAAAGQTATLGVTLGAFFVSLVTEIVTTGLGLSTGASGGDLVRTLLQPPYMIGGVIMVTVIALVVRGATRVLRALFRRRDR
jgi:hypothetical protein